MATVSRYITLNAIKIYQTTTMKLLLLLAASVGLTSAAPAIVWKAGSTSSSGPSHISNAIDTRSLLSSVVSNTNEQSSEESSALAAVIFLVGRNADGSEGMSSLASSGKLPGVQDKHRMASEVHHHVQGVESSRTVAKDAQLSELGTNVAEVSMEEFQRKLSSIAQTTIEEGDDVATTDNNNMKVTKAEQKRRRAISDADVLVVTIGSNDDATKIDAAIVAAIDSSSVRNVILSTIRSTSEVKHARKLAVMDKYITTTKNNEARSYDGTGRRLEDEANNENNNNNNNNQDEAGTYYVNMTPNIFAGLLFFFMFAFTAHLGLSCMNMIAYSDVYTKKLPYIGREV